MTSSDTKYVYYPNNWYTTTPSATKTVIYTWPVTFDTGTSALTFANPYLQLRYVSTTPSITHVADWYPPNFSTRIPELVEQLAARAIRKAEREAARTRAEELLLACLSSGQAEAYRQYGHFETTVDDRIYRINTGRSGNVELMEAGKPKYRYCAHPDLWTPDQDVMLSQLLMLKTDEQRFLKTANRTELAQ
jgi:hypothetical protein